ncbi:hypothetical protein [Microbulbifer sp. GL-2]|uniref:hypothetical protein n=1 Tax=Microbulbifer sp. GL-2 TaxID=2591606 RepID=UPI001164B149|nr:hypothetical protein [Microbulbifer sp. GL-2]BBM03565.1 hypothetical protein GL2_36390 [Microbulbifer sp. GL-2]
MIKEIRSSLFFLVILLSGCTSNIKTQPEDKFLYNFGTIIEDGEFYKIDDYSSEIAWIPGEKFGIRVENISRNEYALGYEILRKDEFDGQFKEVTNGGHWKIAPPINELYEAFLIEESTDFNPGDYFFVVMINGEEARTFSFSIVWPTE